MLFKSLLLMTLFSPVKKSDILFIPPKTESFIFPITSIIEEEVLFSTEFHF